MTNHPARSRGPYTAELGGSTSTQADFGTVRAARQWAASFGSTADYCNIMDKTGKVVGRHVRSRDDDGMRWYRTSAD